MLNIQISERDQHRLILCALGLRASCSYNIELGALHTNIATGICWPGCNLDDGLELALLRREQYRAVRHTTLNPIFLTH